MIAEPYIHRTEDRIEWLFKHPDGLLYSLAARHNSCDLVIVAQADWLSYDDFERKKVRELVGFASIQIWWDGYRLTWTTYLHDPRGEERKVRKYYTSTALIGYRFQEYEKDSESSRLLKRAEFLKAVCEKEGVEWLPDSPERIIKFNLNHCLCVGRHRIGKCCCKCHKISYHIQVADLVKPDFQTTRYDERQRECKHEFERTHKYQSGFVVWECRKPGCDKKWLGSHNDSPPKERDYYTKEEIDERMIALTQMIEGTKNGNHMENAENLFRSHFL